MTRRKQSNANAAPFVFTAMHGVGKRWMADALVSFGLPPYVPVREQIDPNPDFPTVAVPNPEAGTGALLLAFKAAERTCTRLIIANDPDADRLAVAERNDAYTVDAVARRSVDVSLQSDSELCARWKELSGNEIGMLLVDYCWRELREQQPSIDPSKVCRSFCV
jgi:phosphomannomutase